MSNPKLAGYELVRKIAAGGMAEIFLARQWGEAGFFRDVVIKRLFRHLAEHERQLRMFLDEARLLSQLAHPNIPQVYEVGTDAGFWYFAMEHVEGYTVADTWRMGAKLGHGMPLNVALGILVQTCEALHHAHERSDRAGRALRIVHRDVTPHNVMLTRDGFVKLMDFGVASTSARKDTEAGAVRGTFAYMAPEQVRGKQLDKRADVFALGVVLYELTTGSRLFRGSDVQIMTQVVEEDVPPPSERAPGYPEELEEIVLAALQRDRANRIPSAAHLAAYLEEFAMRHGLMIGPRAVARYTSAVTPAQPLLDESLAMVDVAPAPIPDSDSQKVWQPEEEALPDIDESEVLDDLQLLSVPARSPSSSQERVPEPLRLPDDDDSEAENLDHLLDEPSEGPGELRFEESGSLVLDGFSEDGPKDQPVLLLDQASRKDNKKKADKKAEPQDDADYMAELERRFADDDDVV